MHPIRHPRNTIIIGGAFVFVAAVYALGAVPLGYDIEWAGVTMLAAGAPGAPATEAPASGRTKEEPSKTEGASAARNGWRPRKMERTTTPIGSL